MPRDDELVAMTVAAITEEADDEATLAIEAAAVEPTDNGWRDADPLDQPDNPEEPWGDD